MTSEAFAGTRPLLLFLSLLFIAKDVETQCIQDQAPACPIGWYKTKNPEVCLRLTTNLVTATEAKATCRNGKANVMMPQYPEITNGILEYMNLAYKRLLWIGLHKTDGTQYYHWGSDTTEATHVLKWQPTAGMTEPCVAIDLETHLYVDQPCVQQLHFICTLPAVCHGGQSGEECARVVSKMNSWQNASQACIQSGRILANIRSLTVYGYIQEELVKSTRTQLDFTDEANERIWIWANKAPLLDIPWGQYEPSNSRTENCAGMDSTGTFLDWSCNAAYPYMCQKLSRTSPSEVKMKVRYNQPPNIVYIDTDLIVECTAFNTESDKFTWVLHGTTPNIAFDRLQATVTNSHETATKLDGTCGKKTTSTIKFKVRTDYNNMQLSCYAYDAIYDARKVCSNALEDFSFCDISKIMRVTDIPKGVRMKPIVFHEPSNIVYVNTTFSVACTEVESKLGRLIWKIDAPSTDLAALKPKTEEHTEYARKIGYSINETTSTITFNVTESLQDMVISCHQVGTAQIKCTDSYRNLNLCDKSPQFQVKKDASLIPPELKVRYYGYPGTVYDSTTIKAKCSVLHGGKGTLIWVIYFPGSGPKAINYNKMDDKYITGSSLSKQGRGSHMISHLRVPIKMKDSGISLACFAYNIRQYRPTSLECMDGEIYCVKTHKIVVLPTPPSEPISPLWYFWWLFIVLLVIFTCIMLWPVEGENPTEEGEGLSTGNKRRGKVRKFKKIADKHVVRTRTILIAWLIRRLTQAKKLKKRIVNSRRRKPANAAKDAESSASSKVSTLNKLMVATDTKPGEDRASK